MVDEGGENVNGDDLHIVRLSFEARSPLSIGSGESRTEARTEPGSGEETAISVSEIQRDANGLPAVPGAGLQGVLRRLAAEVHDEAFANEMFGREDAGGDGAAGRVLCGWACVHDASDVAVCGLRLPCLDTSNDDVLRLLTQPEPLWRDHVALNDRHSVDHRRKFARAAVPVGARFSVELNGWGDDGFQDKLIRIVSLFRHPRFRLGAGSGRGYGRIRLFAASHEAPSLDDAAELRRLREQPPSARLSTDLLPCLVPSNRNLDTVLTLKLKCADLLRIGAVGSQARPLTHRAQRARCVTSGAILECGELGQPEQEGADAILTLLREPRIAWPGNRGRSVEIGDDPAASPAEQLRFPIPGSSIRGPLAHRMLFQANRAAGRCINVDDWLRAKDDETQRKKLKTEYEGYRQRCPDLDAFLGAAKDSMDFGNQTDDSGRASRVLFSDAEALGVRWIVGVDHVSIDRFTGGARDGALFREETLLGGRIEATVTIRPPLETVKGGANTVGGWPEATANAFLLAVRDLCRGRLPLGGRGHGECLGHASFSEGYKGDWLKAAQAVGVPIGGTGT